MCGLIYSKRFDDKNAVKMTIKRYEEQKSRGTEGFGFVALTEGVVTKYLRSAYEKGIVEALREVKADEVLFHHRNPTSTDNVWECAHPIKVSIPTLTHDFYVIHNGVISNTEELKKEHDKEKIKYTTLLREYWLSEAGNVREGVQKWNDSESLAIELAKSLDGKEEGIAGVKGSIAFLVIKVERARGKAVKLYWGRNYLSPLLMYRDDLLMTITSTGKGEAVLPHRLHSFDYATGIIEDKPFTVGTAAYSTPYYSREYDDPYERTADERKPLGFERPLPLIGAPKDEDYFMLEKYLDDKEDLISIKDSLKKATDPDMINMLLIEQAKVEEAIRVFEKKYPSLTAKT